MSQNLSFSQRLTLAVEEVCPPLDQCLVCERQGLPVLLLRRARVPDLRPAFESPDGRPDETQIGLRTLRMGYLYVLLQHRQNPSRKVWQAYQVTEHGHLRRFSNPYEAPFGSPPPLAQHCVNQDHDIPAAFLNLDTDTYSTAWLAFASDPWPRQVLDDYKSGQAPINRFKQLDLDSARENPASVGLAMTPDNPQINRLVLEYAHYRLDEFSMHGFHSHAKRLHALNGYLGNAINEHQLPQGVLALELDDVVGLVQEFNGARLGWIERRQQWREDPQRAYELQTSQCLLAIRAAHRSWAQQQTASFEPMSGDGPPVFTDPQIQRQETVERRALDYDRSLERRYDEARRAAFQAQYDREEARFQSLIDINGSAYAKVIRLPAFQRIEEYDYDEHDEDSAQAYGKTLSLCLRGGISEAPRPPEPQTPAPQHSTEQLWLEWLRNPDNPPYRAMLLRNGSLLAALRPSFDAQGTLDWNDSEKLYSALVKVIGSDETKRSLRRLLQEAMAELLGAINAAGQRLKTQLGPGVQRAVMRLNSASQWLHNGVHLVELQVKMKLGEYYALQSEHLRQLQTQANEAMAKVRKRVMRSVAQIDLESRQPLRAVRPIIQQGLLSLAVLDPKLAGSLITVSIWVEGKAADLHTQLSSEMNRAAGAAHSALSELTVAIGTLDPKARQLLQGLQVSSQQVSRLVKTGFSGLRGVAGSGELLLVLGGLYLLSDSLKKNTEQAEKEIGEKSTEAILALHGASLAVLGGGMEAVGLILREGAKGVTTADILSSNGPSRVASARKLGEALVRIGAVIGVTAGLYDAIRAGFSSSRAWKAGDIPAARFYFSSGVLSVVGVAYGLKAIVSGAYLLSGPLGAAILLGLLAYAAFNSGKEEESTALELWTKRCCFGRANESPPIHWSHYEQADIAFAELNAATLGLDVSLTFEKPVFDSALVAKTGTSGVPKKLQLRYRIVLPGFSQTNSGYSWTLTIHRLSDGLAPLYTGGELIIQDSINQPSRTTLANETQTASNDRKPCIPDYESDKIAPKKITLTQKSPVQTELSIHEIAGSIALIADLSKHAIEAATLTLTYWPDRDTPDGYAKIIVMERN